MVANVGQHLFCLLALPNGRWIPVLAAAGNGRQRRIVCECAGLCAADCCHRSTGLVPCGIVHMVSLGLAIERGPGRQKRGQVHTSDYVVLPADHRSHGREQGRGGTCGHRRIHRRIAHGHDRLWRRRHGGASPRQVLGAVRAPHLRVQGAGMVGEVCVLVRRPEVTRLSEVARKVRPARVFVAGGLGRRIRQAGPIAVTSARRCAARHVHERAEEAPKCCTATSWT
mmetsp:Transcript_16917/g.59099  ORF Transcript_16917/g.59099 Transcript_16917/m.59099 type:complete len:226 (+) Transcript_16917:422-1099(+)